MSKINVRHPLWDDDDIEYFQCDCHSREHTIYAYADKLGDEDTGKILYDGINLRFVVGRYDTEVGCIPCWDKGHDIRHYIMGIRDIAAKQEESLILQWKKGYFQLN